MQQRVVMALAAALLLGACTGTVVVPDTSFTLPEGMKPIEGHFAAQIQTGGWQLTTKSKGLMCGAWSFEGDLNGSYWRAMSNALNQGLQEVDFVPETLTPAEIAAKGYTAEIIVYQGNAQSNFAIQQGFFTNSAESGVELTVILAILRQDGLKYQQTITSRSRGEAEAWIGCEFVAEAVGGAASEAIGELTEKMLLYIRDALRN